MASYTLKLTPDMINMASEGSMDTSILNGVSIQRTGFIEVPNTGKVKKLPRLADGATFDDTIPTIADDSNIA